MIVALYNWAVSISTLLDMHGNAIFFFKLTRASEGVPETDGEPEPVLHGATPHQLLGVVVTETEHLIGWSIRLILDLANPCNSAQNSKCKRDILNSCLKMIFNRRWRFAIENLWAKSNIKLDTCSLLVCYMHDHENLSLSQLLAWHWWIYLERTLFQEGNQSWPRLGRVCLQEQRTTSCLFFWLSSWGGGGSRAHAVARVIYRDVARIAHSIQRDTPTMWNATSAIHV